MALEDQTCVSDLFDLRYMGLFLNLPLNSMYEERKEGLVRMMEEILVLHLALGGFPDGLALFSARFGVPEDKKFIGFLGIYM